MAEAAQTTDQTQTEDPSTAAPPAEPTSSAATEPTAAPEPAPKLPLKDKSLGEGGGGEDGPQPVPADWPEDWRNRLAGSNEDALKTLNRFKSPDGVWKSYQALRQRMNSGEYQRAMPETDDEEALAAWRAEVGVPEEPKGYYEALPEGVEIADQDRPIVDRYFERMHKAGAAPRDVTEGLAALYEEWERQKEEQAEADQEHRNQTEDELRASWGPEYRGNLNAMHNLFDTLGHEGLREELFTARMMNPDGTPGRPLGDHPGFLSFMVDLAREINPTGTVIPSDGRTQIETIDARIAAIEQEMGDTRGKAGPDAYWNNPAKQEEYRRLVATRDKLASRA